jgi:hypothetical protein
MPTPKSLRAAPPRRFENYILTRVTAPGTDLTPIPDRLFEPVESSTVTSDYADDPISNLQNIGFDFNLDGIVYKRYICSTNGWMALAGPSETNPSTIQSTLIASATWANEGIRETNSSQNVLLAPWFDDLRNTTQNLANVVGSSDKRRRIGEGLETPPITYRPIDFGVRTYFDPRGPRGRRRIIRWTSISDYANGSTVIKFEVVFNENGVIEYRYTPRKNITLSPTKWGTGADDFIEDATIGIFMPGTLRFRDFALGLGRSERRQQYIYGGAVYDPNFFDTGFDNFAGQTYSRPYVWRLVPGIHWPGLDTAGAAFIFSPPVNRRKVLPRLAIHDFDNRLSMPTVARTGDTRRGNNQVIFDDRRSAPFTAVTVVSGVAVSGSVVNYPTTLQRFFGDSEPSCVDRQNLFAGDFLITASVVKSAIDPFIGSANDGLTTPFFESSRYEIRADGTTTSFESGSSISQLGDGLSQHIKSKTQIKLSLPISYQTTMFGVSSSMYYYNRRIQAWQVPGNSTSPSNGSNQQSRSDITTLTADSQNRRILEDAKGFGPIGNAVMSGSHTRTGPGDQSDASIGAPFSTANVTDAVSKFYAKSVQANSDYRATGDEIFQLPISHPFLIEKAVIEIPIMLGPGWFNDKTTCFVPLEASPGAFDFAGPGMTVALYNQTVFGGNSRRDLILTGTITHQQDNYAELVVSNFPSIDTTYQIRPRGFPAFGAAPSVVVAPTTVNGTSQFTGSVAVKCEAQVSNGVIVRLEFAMTGATANNRSGVLDVFNTPEIALGNQVTTNYAQSSYIAYVNNFGRGATGFDPSGRSAFGKEFATSQLINVKGKIPNPFYLSQSNGGLTFNNLTTLPGQYLPAVTGGTNYKFEAAVPLENYLPAPYLVTPNDTLVLAISKMRPFFYGTLATTPFTSGNIVHDVNLITGTINITLYGSLLREGKEFHDTLNQPLASNAVHEIVAGNEPIIDQFEADYRDLYVSGTYDNVVAGNMISKIVRPDGRIIFVTGSVVGSPVATSILSRGTRGKIYGNNNARDAGIPGTTDIDFTTSKAFRQQPYSEKAGTVRVAQHIDNTERFWDSLMPAVNQCFLADGAGIFLLRRQGDSASAWYGNYIGDAQKVDQRIGFLWFDYQAPVWFPTWGALLDGVWTWSFPFEPRYSTIPRQQFIERSFLANYSVDFFGGFGSAAPVQAIDPVPLQGFFFGPVGTELPSVPARQHTNTAGPVGGGAAFDYHWVCDSYMSSSTQFGYILTSSAGVSDAVKCLFGFGDMNNRVYVGSGFGSNAYFGNTHWADFRLRDPDPFFNWGSKWGLSPIIRGWKYGVYNGLPTFNKAYYRQRSYGQFRDMLEQRPFTKFYQTAVNKPDVLNFQEGTTPAPVTVKFVDANGRLTKPENTWSQNLSFEATSSVPYFDGETRNRGAINTDVLNTKIIAFKQNQFGQVTL